MKKFFSFLIVLVAALTANAQIYSYETTAMKVDKIRNNTNTTWYIRAGLSNNTLSSTPSGFDPDSKLGYEISAGFQKPFTNLGFYWGMELGLGSQGYEYEDKIEDYKMTDMGHVVRYSPITLGFKYDISALDITLDAHVGGFISYTYGGEFELQEGDYDVSEDHWEFNGDYFDYGMKLGLGAWWKKFNLDFSYQRGFTSQWLDEGDFEDSYYSSFIISLGYAF